MADALATSLGLLRLMVVLVENSDKGLPPLTVAEDNHPQRLTTISILPLKCFWDYS